MLCVNNSLPQFPTEPSNSWKTSEEMGFADVTPQAMLAHIKDTYGNLTADEIEKNRNSLSAVWNVDDNIEDLWLRIRDAQRLAVRAGEPIPDAAAMRLTLAALEATGVFEQATLANFKLHFTKENKAPPQAHRQDCRLPWCTCRDNG
jgi:hypothetical protein